MVEGSIEPAGNERIPSFSSVGIYIRVDEKLANDLIFKIDDGRPTAFSAKEGWLSLRAIGSMLGSLGIQEANRKRTMPSTTPGEWDGTSADSSNDSTTGLVSLKKWIKGQKIMCRIQEELREKSDLDHKALERDRGFLISCLALTG